MLPAPWLIALAFAIALLALIPARRLRLAGFSARTVGAYAGILWILAMVMAIRPIGVRFLLPFLLVAYIAPFVAAPDAIRRIADRGSIRRPGAWAGPPGGRPPMKDVTPPDDDATDGADDPGSPG